jgi:hypothetical protein
MLRSVLVGVDGSEYSTAAVALGSQWAQRSGAVFVGLGIIDARPSVSLNPCRLGEAPTKCTGMLVVHQSSIDG